MNETFIIYRAGKGLWSAQKKCTVSPWMEPVNSGDEPKAEVVDAENVGVSIPWVSNVFAVIATLLPSAPAGNEREATPDTPLIVVATDNVPPAEEVMVAVC